MNLFAGGGGRGGDDWQLWPARDPTVLSPSMDTNREKGRGALCESKR